MAIDASSPRARRALAAAAACSALALAAAGCGSGASNTSSHAKTVTVYSADGLKGDNNNGWYDKVFADFTKKTGIKVDYVEGGSGEVVQRAVREKTNTQADLLVTLPPFIQQAESKGLLTPYKPAGADAIAGDALKDPKGEWYTIVNNYLCFVYNKQQVKTAPTTWQELLGGRYRNKLQYSTPGVAGDGTGVLIKAMHDMGEAKALAYFTQLQKNNVGPSSSTGKLAAKVDKGEILVANGDLQMSYAQSTGEDKNLGIWFPKGADGRPTTFADPYAAGVVKNAPHSANAKKLLDFMLTKQAQQEATTVGGGFPARADVKPTGKVADDLKRTMAGVEVFSVDWNDVSTNLQSYIAKWQNATGS
ncbi:2-aminoethylphosphonate ABC transporter substrate-binding protein [Mangrovactinospora gilvigrisea]|uniref:2-aminoethylphosphonate ABC transporter substrate-binding protein n=1 Tax=Mangrovactinospora gilvigrisea TaxID=1428644 RepID=A0A1J7C9S5_9ACTN|nr:2-aminoethylphosphonate ABC transporter substrate-binding protein [Mangrovactinospora gilvigrisea]OIV38268.1 2-aminoethylphosphonate ABC transporter substrate-binding protein [Mangrovactinospora gilvigrisea]